MNRVVSVTADNLVLAYDELGNLKSRHRSSGNPFAPTMQTNESYCYDTLNRLIKTHIGTQSGSCGGTADTTYDVFGNLTKMNALTYTYPTGPGAVRPHAVTNLKNAQNDVVATYTYDTNGNMTGDTIGRTFTYSVFDQMTQVQKGTTDTLRFTYGIDRQRNYREETVAGSTTKTFYMGSAERVELPSGTKEIRRRIGNEVVVIHTVDGSGTITSTNRRFQMVDHLGSPVAVYDGNAIFQEHLSFGTWGERRNFDTTLPPLLPYTNITTDTVRGYTGHEHGDAFGIIHMNGRVYDPTLGRMLQADPFVDGATNTQGYNRYSYAHNNPLRYTDSSGYGIDIFDAVKIGIGVVAFVYTWEPSTLAWAIGSISGVQAAANGANFAGISVAAFSGAAMAYVGGEFALGGVSPLEVAGFGALGGLASSLSGGNFGHGFVSAGAGLYVGGELGMGGTGGEIAQRTVIKSLVTGTISELTGGKFANGAATAAFASIVAEGALAARTRNYTPISPVNHDVSIGPSGTMDINSPDYQLEVSMAVDFATPSTVAPIGRVTSVDPNFSFRFATASPSVPGASIGSASGLYGTELMAGTPGQLAGQLQAQVLSIALGPVVIGLNPGAALSGAALSSAVNFGMGQPITLQGVFIDAAISSAVAPIGFARFANNHWMAKRTDFVRTESAGFGLKSALTGD